MATPLDPAEEALALLPPEQAALLRARIRPMTQSERLDRRDAAVIEVLTTFYEHIRLDTPRANTLAADLARHAAVMHRDTSCFNERERRRRELLTTIIELSGGNPIGARCILYIMDGCRTPKMK